MDDFYCFYRSNDRFSNFYPVKIFVDGIEYNSVEHCFQCAKASTQEDFMKVYYAKTASAAKREGRKITLRSDWEQIKNNVMYNCLFVKFSKEPFRTALYNTIGKYIVEASPTDGYWGAKSNVNSIYLNRNFPGKNMLGQLIMKLRDEEFWPGGVPRGSSQPIIPMLGFHTEQQVQKEPEILPSSTQNVPDIEFISPKRDELEIISFDFAEEPEILPSSTQNVPDIEFISPKRDEPEIISSSIRNIHDMNPVVRIDYDSILSSLSLSSESESSESESFDLESDEDI